MRKINQIFIFANLLTLGLLFTTSAYAQGNLKPCAPDSVILTPNDRTEIDENGATIAYTPLCTHPDYTLRIVFINNKSYMDAVVNQIPLPLGNLNYAYAQNDNVVETDYPDLLDKLGAGLLKETVCGPSVARAETGSLEPYIGLDIISNTAQSMSISAQRKASSVDQDHIDPVAHVFCPFWPWDCEGECNKRVIRLDSIKWYWGKCEREVLCLCRFKK